MVSRDLEDVTTADLVAELQSRCSASLIFGVLLVNDDAVLVETEGHALMLAGLADCVVDRVSDLVDEMPKVKIK